MSDTSPVEPLDYCDEHGHALHTIGGVVQTYCLRCGDEIAPAAPRSQLKAILNAIYAQDNTPSSELCPIHGAGCEAWA